MIAQLTILDQMHLRFNNIKLINGYSVDLLKIKRAKLTPFKNGDLPALNYWPGADVLINKQGGVEARRLSVSVEMYGKTRDEPFTDVAFRMGVDIVTALMRDPAFPNVADDESLSLGGLVSGIEAGSITPVISGEEKTPWCGAVVEVSVFYNTEIGKNFNIFNF